MLLFGDHTLVESVLSNFNNVYFVNLSSYKENVGRAIDMVPPNLLDYYSKDFDINYANYIFGNDEIFYNFFSNIIKPLSEGVNVYVLVKRDEDIFDALTESVQKLIQCRYGYISFIVNTMEDLLYIDDSIGTFSLTGVYNFDIDNEKYIYMNIKGGLLC